MSICQKDLDRLRALAHQQAELAASPEMAALRADWAAHGRFDTGARPLIRIELKTFEKDIIPPLMECEGDEARGVEQMLLSNIVNHTLFGDDTLVRDHIGVPPKLTFVPFGLPVQRKMASNGIGHHFISQISDLEEDFNKLGASVYGCDMESGKREVERLSDIFGDILPVREEGRSYICCPTQDIVHIMDMADMYASMYDAPELFHKMLDRLTDDYIAHFAQMEQKGQLRAAARDEHLCQGTYCFTDELPQEGEGVRLTDCWLYMDSQETAGISPEMFKEFIAPYYRKVASRFGLLSYGCCEAVHALWDGFLDSLPNLRKVSISPWCDEEKMGEHLRGKRIVYLRKPSPNFLGVGSVLDEDAVRAHFQKTVQAARGCALEIAQRDVYEIHAGPEKVRRYVELARESMERHVRA